MNKRKSLTRETKFMIIVGIFLFLTISVGVICAHYLGDYPQDNIVEEIIEEVIEDYTHLDIDLTPHTPEKGITL